MFNKVGGFQYLGAVSALAVVFSIISTPAMAQTADDFAAMKAEIQLLRDAQAKSDAEIAQLRARLGTDPERASALNAAPLDNETPDAGSYALDDAPVNIAMEAPANASKLAISGDFRLRYESNFGDSYARNRDRGVLRARLRAAYAVKPWLTIGAQIATGDANDPNSTDITLSNFNDDFDVSLDQAYAKIALGNLTIHGGKMPQPFVRTELVWDGDVNPQGVSASYKFDLGGGTSLKANALYFLIDESVAGKNSDMIGGQIAFESSASAYLELGLAVGYYDYQLGSTAGGDAGDYRSNRFVAGKYLSDFNLLNVIASVQYNGLGEAWPIRLIGDYVHNFGSTVSDDSGFGVDLWAGRALRTGDMRFGYGYAQTGVDAVLAAFSHDNTNIGTNYRQHSLSVDFVPVHNLILNATYYRYRPKDVIFSDSNISDEWIDRLRLNMLVNF